MLYALTPVGVGTEQVEALTSYLSRLASAHIVPPACLLKHICQRAPSKDPSALNGMSAGTAAVVSALKERTGIARLDRLTLLPWKGVLSSTNSLAKTQRWCPRCLNEWQTRGTSLHYPLAWCLSTVRWCMLHQCRLASRCPNPHCGSSITLLSAPGHCEACGAWLGGFARKDCGREPHPEADIWFTNATAGLISRGQSDSGIHVAGRVPRFFAALVDAVGEGNLDPFRTRMGLPRDMLYRWRSGRSLPSIDMFLTFFARLGVEPDDIFDGKAVKELAELVRPIEIDRKLRAAPRAANRRLDRAVVRQALDRALRIEMAPPTLSQLANELGVSYQLIRYHFPDLAKAVCVRHQASRRKVARNSS